MNVKWTTRRGRPRRFAAVLLVAALGATVGSSGPALGAGVTGGEPSTTGRPYSVVWDDFRHGFHVTGPRARWDHITAGPYVADDGRISTSRRGLYVASSGTNARTGQPAFAHTIPQEHDGEHGLPGTLDHAKWFAFVNHTASTGVLGFDAVPGQVLTCRTTLSARTFGVRNHPFGRAVRDPDSDLRLASVSMNVYDPETAIVFDFFLANNQIYAFYERLPGMRPTLGDYAAFTYAIPVARRSPGDWHDLQISYDRSAGLVRWSVDGREVFRVDRLGLRLPSARHMVIDHGGVPARVAPRQLRCGMGLLSLLDARLGDQPALVRLSDADSFYFDPAKGQPVPQRFRDERSRPGSRLFGQGAQLRMSRYAVSSLPVQRRSGS